MKKKLFVLLLTVAIACIFAISVSAITTYDDAPVRTKYTSIEDDIVEFYDGFKCPVSYVFKDTDFVDRSYNKSGGSFQNYFDFEYINGKTGKNYTFEDVKGFDIPEGINSIGIYAGRELNTLKWISIPKTATKLSGAIFQGNTGLEECYFEFDENTPLTKFPGYTFYGCKSLKAFSMPDCFTRIDDVGTFTGCNNMTAVYLSKNLTEWSSGGGGSRSGTFDDCYNMYFVNEPFGKGEIPEKPEVYYFPANLQTITNQSVMRECKNLNNVLVFGKKLTSMPNAYFFQSGPKNTIVFLGDMEKVSPMYWGSTANIVFANPADKDASSVELVPYNNNYGHACSYYFCSTGNKYAANKSNAGEIIASLEANANLHVTEKTLSTEATCINPKMLADYCFCGAIMGEPQTEGTALGHNYTGAVSYVFDSLITDGKQCTVCVNGCGIDEEKVLGAVYTALGYSVKTFGTSYSFVSGYDVNVESLALYEQAKNVELQFGFAFNAASTFTEGDVTLESFKIVAPVAGKAGDTVFSFYQYQMSYTDDTNLDADIVIAAYVIEKSEDSEALTFINRADGTVNGFNPVNYNKALELAE